jgi:hypothetical protein
MDQGTPSSESKSGYRPDGEHPQISAQKARQGVELGTMRYVLGISLGLAIVAVVVAYFVFVVFHG